MQSSAGYNARRGNQESSSPAPRRNVREIVQQLIQRPALDLANEPVTSRATLGATGEPEAESQSR